MNIFDGKKIRDQILSELKTKIHKSGQKSGLAVLCIGDNPVCSKYISLKKKVADKLGVHFFSYSFDSSNSQKEILDCVTKLNKDENFSGIMVQMPIPDHFDKFEIVNTITPKKDVDGLRFCCTYRSDFQPPVVLAIMEAIKSSSICHFYRNKNKKIIDRLIKTENDSVIKECLSDKKVVVVGKGFLVGWPLAQCLKNSIPNLIVADENTKNLSKTTKIADIIISAVGKANIIMPKMIKDGVVLIDAGTTEISGELKGDINPACYKKASFYTPVPGGIGPVTIAKLFENLVKKSNNKDLL